MVAGNFLKKNPGFKKAIKLFVIFSDLTNKLYMYEERFGHIEAQFFLLRIK